jgi:hypothetical protein
VDFHHTASGQVRQLLHVTPLTTAQLILQDKRMILDRVVEKIPPTTDPPGQQEQEDDNDDDQAYYPLARFSILLSIVDSEKLKNLVASVNSLLALILARIDL